MEVFHFDPVTGKRGPFIENAPYALQLSGPAGATANLPHRPGEDWSVASAAADRQGQPITYPHPVCFCTGEFSAGTDTAWHWHALMPAKS